LILLIAVAVLDQGCVAAAWVAAVCADSMRAGDIRFQPFEASWVSGEPPAAMGGGRSLTTVALMPVDGDDAMGARLTTLLSQETALRVVMPGRLDPPASLTAEDHERAELARQAGSSGFIDGRRS
jgi:hypothetical protein